VKRVDKSSGWGDGFARVWRCEGLLLSMVKHYLAVPIVLPEFNITFINKLHCCYKQFKMYNTSWLITNADLK